jgi:hypothetical protein
VLPEENLVVAVVVVLVVLVEVVEEEEEQKEAVKDIYLPAVCNQGLRGLLDRISLAFFELRCEPCLVGSLLQPPVGMVRFTAWSKPVLTPLLAS